MIVKTKVLVGCLIGVTVTSSWQSVVEPSAVMAKTAGGTAASQVYSKANPAVVTIRSGASSWGSGFIINQDGWVITNAHVVDGAPSVVTLMMADGKTELPADVVGFAKGGVDLAILKINGRRKLPSIKLGNSKSVSVGDQVYAIGTPLSEKNQNTFTTGIVSALRTGVVQHSASISKGNSGGPLLNSQGEVIGVNTAIATASVECPNGEYCGRSLGNVGIGYAVVIDIVKDFLSDIKAGNISPVSTLEN